MDSRRIIIDIRSQLPCPCLINNKIMIRALFITLLIVSVCSQTITINPLNQTGSSLSANAGNSSSGGFTQDPIDSFDSLHSFLQYIIRDAFPFIGNSPLIDAKQKISNTSGDILYVYTFQLYANSTGNLTANQTNSTNQTSYAVLGTNNNTEFLVYDGNTFSKLYNRSSINQSQSSKIVGGYSPIDITNLTLDEQNAENFVLDNVPSLNNWTLISGRSQIVSGVNYCFDYKQSSYANTTQEYCVWSQPWNNDFLQLTLPNGTKIVSTLNATNSTSPYANYNGTLGNSSLGNSTGAR